MHLSPEQFALIQSLVEEHSAISFGTEKTYLVQSRLKNYLADNPGTTLDTFMARLRARHPATVDALVDMITTNETSFFRDDHPFEALTQVILPRLIHARRDEQTLRIWCAACSTGQEPYSLAMLLASRFQQIKHWKLEFLASDISPTALAQARHGIYSSFELSRGLPPDFKERFFEPTDTRGEWQVARSLRDQLSFQRINLAKTWPLYKPVDLLMMRNVLIYFTPQVRQDILTRAARLLSPEGVLMLGSPESARGLENLLQLHSHGSTSYYTSTGNANLSSLGMPFARP